LTSESKVYFTSRAAPYVAAWCNAPMSGMCGTKVYWKYGCRVHEPEVCV
jgi:hypothetical protein